MWFNNSILMKKRVWVIGLIAAGTVYSTGCGNGQESQKDKPAPIVVDNTVEKMVKAQGETVEGRYAALEETFRNPELTEAFRPYHEKIRLLKKMTQWRIEKIERMKIEMLAAVDNVSIEEATKRHDALESVAHLDDYEATTRYFGTDDTQKTENGKAAQLKKDIASYRDSLLGKPFLGRPQDTALFKFSLGTDDVVKAETKEKVAWEKFYFYHLPYPAANTELAKWQNNIRAAESEMLDYLVNEYLKNNPGKTL